MAACMWPRCSRNAEHPFPFCDEHRAAARAGLGSTAFYARPVADLSEEQQAILALGRSVGMEALGRELIADNKGLDEARRAFATAGWLSALRFAGSWRRH